MYAWRWLWFVSCVRVLGLAGVRCGAGGRVQVLGEISFGLKVPESRAGRNVRARESAATRSVSNMTQAVPVECVYQYPETKQVDAILSNMMNQLTKMFVRVHSRLRAEWGARREDKRFKVVQDSSADFFDTIYYNMTEEYRRFVNHTRSRVQPAARGDPCQHQREIRDVWRALLTSSRECVRRAALACVEEYLRVLREDEAGAGLRGDGAGAGLRGRARSRASRLLRTELARVRRDQLALLCDTFQLCFDDLL